MFHNPPGSVINHGNGWTTTTPVFPGVPGGGHSIYHYTGIYTPTPPTLPPNYNWNPPVINPLPHLDIPNNLNYGSDIYSLSRKLEDVSKELNISISTNSSSMLDASFTLSLLNVLNDKNISDDRFVTKIKEKKNALLYLNSILEQKSRLQNDIENQESVRIGKVEELAKKYRSENGFRGFFLEGKESAFQVFLQLNTQNYFPAKDVANDWNKYVVEPIIKLYGDKYSLITLLNQVSSVIEVTEAILREPLSTDEGINGWGMFSHYRENSGRTLTLSEIGVHDQITALIKKPSAFEKEGSVQSRFISQIQRGERIFFKNQYDFAIESIMPIIDPIWAIGGATVSGKLTVVKVEKMDDKYQVSGVINYELYDKFTDPYDWKNITGKEWNPNGTPYDITGKWEESVSFNVNEDIYENTIKPIISQ